MVDLWFLTQFGKIGSKSPSENPLSQNTQKEEKKTEQSSSFQWAENLKEEAEKINKEKKQKLETDAAYRNQQIEDYKKDDEKASWKNAGELWAWQIWRDIKSDWKNAYNNEKESIKRDIDKDKEDDGKISVWEGGKGYVKHSFSAAWRALYNTARTILKPIWWLADTILESARINGQDAKIAREAQREAKDQWASRKEQQAAYDKSIEESQAKRINKILEEDIDKQDTVKDIATDRLIQNATIMQKKDEEVSASIEDLNKEYEEKAQLEQKLFQMEEDRKNWVVSWPERDTDYLATVNALKSKKTSIEQKTELLNQKLAEYDELQKEHQLKEYELLPFTDNYYETEAEAEKYRNLFWDKLYKNEDWSIMSQWDQKDRDIYSVMKWLERVVFSEAEWIRDEKTPWKFWSLFGFWEDYTWFETGEDYLKNSEDFLNLAYNAFSDVKQKLMDNYDQLCDTVMNGSWEEVKVLNQDKVAAFLQQNKSGLGELSDYILWADSWTKYRDIKFWRYLDWDEWKVLEMWKDLWWLSDLLWSMTASRSKAESWLFHYDKARDWINQSTWNFWFANSLWQMVAQNPAKTAYICGSMYFAVAGKWAYAMDAEKATALSWRLATRSNWMLWIYKSSKWAVSSAEWLSRLWWLTPTKSQTWNKIIDTTIRKWVWSLDEIFVSLPLDLWLNDKTQKDLNMNILFNVLWWFGKIQSLSDMKLFQKTLIRQGDAVAMQKYFSDYTGLPELANKINWNSDGNKIIEQVDKAFSSHWNNIMGKDSHKAAWFMSQYINKNIDSLWWEQMDEVEAFSKAVVENGNLWASLWKNRAKNISQILADAKAKLAKTKDWTQILTIQNAAVKKVKAEFKSILDSFDVEKLNKLYKKNFASNQIWQWFENFIEEWEKSTWVPKEDLMLIFIDSMNKRTWISWPSVVDVFNQRVVQWLSDGSLKSSKWAKAWVKWASEASQATSKSMWQLLDITDVAEKDPERAADLLSELEEHWLHDVRESVKWLSPEEVAKEEKRIAKGLEETKAWINAAKEEKIKEAEWLRASVDSVAKEAEKSAEKRTLEEDFNIQWHKVLDYAKNTSNDPELLKRLSEEEEKYLKATNEINYDDIVKADKERWLKSFEDDEEFMDEVEESGMTLEEYMEKNNIKYDDKLKQRAIDNWKKENNSIQSLSEKEWLPADKRLAVIEDYLKEKYWIDFSQEAAAKAKEDEIKAIRWELIDINNEVEKLIWWNGSLAKKLKVKREKWKFTVKWDLSKLTDEEIALAKKTIEDWYNDWTKVDNLTPEIIEKTIVDMKKKEEGLQNTILETQELLASSSEGEIKNVYKDFSRAVDAYILDKSNVDKITAQKKATAGVDYETVFLKLWEKETLEGKLKDYNKILEALWDKWDEVGWAASEIRKVADDASVEIRKQADDLEAAAEKEAQDKIKEAEQLALDMTNEVKKRWLQNEITEWVNKFVDLFENSVPVIKKTGILDTTKKIANSMDDITQKNFLWSLWATIEWMMNKTSNSSILDNLSKSIVDWWSSKFTKNLIKDISKAVTNANWTVDIVKLKDFAGSLYDANSKRANQIKNWELEDLVKELVQKKVSQNMVLSVTNPSNIGQTEKSAMEIASDVIADTTSKIKDPTLAQLNQKLWKQSADAMVLYQQALDTAARKANETKDSLSEITELKRAQDSVSAKSNKRMNAEKREKKAIEQVEDLITAEPTPQWALWGLDTKLANNIKSSVEEEKNLWEWAKRAKTYLADNRLTEKEKTLVRFGAVEEAQKIMEAVSKWKKPTNIKAEFLDWEWYMFLKKLLNFGPNEKKESELFYNAFMDSRRQVQWFGYQLFYSLKNVLYNGTDSLKTSNWKFNLNDILTAIPTRITSNIKWKWGWIVYDARVTLTKYIMESNPEETTKIMKWALEEYFKTALAKNSRADLGRKFLEVFDKQASNLDTPSIAADEFMNLYTRISKRLKDCWVDDRIVQDIMNPMFYNPLEYIRWIAMASHPESKAVLKWQAMEDMVIWTILSKHLWQWNNLPEALDELYISTKKWAEYFERFVWGSIIRNKNAMEFWDALWAYYSKIDSLPIWQEQFADWMNKTLSHIVSLWDEVTRKVTAIESLMNPLYDIAKKTLWDTDDYKNFMEVVDKFLFSEQWGLKHTKELQEWYEWFKTAVGEFWIKGSDVNEILDVLKQSLDAREVWDSRVISNFLYDRVSKNADEFMKKSWITPDKFNPADIINRKALQDSVMEEYGKKSMEDLVGKIISSRKTAKKYTKKWKVEYAKQDMQNQANIKAMVETYWIDPEEAKDINTLLTDADFEKLLKEWELSPEYAQKEILKRMTSNKETFDKLMAENGFFKWRVTDTFNKVFDEKEMKAWEQYFTIGKHWEFVLRQKVDEYNWLLRNAANLTTKGNVMSKDEEAAWILAWLNKTRDTAYVRNDIDFGGILWKKELDTVWRNIWLPEFIELWKASVYKLAKKLDKKNADSIIAEAINRVFKWLPNNTMDEMMATPSAKDFVRFLEAYKQGIDKTRNTLELWEHWKYLFAWWDDFAKKWLGANKLANRLWGMWNYLSTDDIQRLGLKYDSSKWMWGLWSNFTKNIIYNARADLSDSTVSRILSKANMITQKYAIAKNYNVTQLTKAWQQVVSNLLHANWILKSVAVAWTSEFDDLFKVIQNSSVRNLWFDIFESEWKYWERLLDKAKVNVWNKWEKARQKMVRKKDWNFLKNTWLFGKDLATSNALMRWDRATQKRAVKSSLALATDEIYRLGWEQAVEEFTKKFDKYTELIETYWLKERDLMDSDRFFEKSTQTLNSPKMRAKNWFDESQVGEYYAKHSEDMEFIYNFYRNEYAPFMWRARTSMWTFFVMDDIKELGSIEMIDNNKYLFWLMKWSVGKIWEYTFDVWTAFKKFDWTRRGFLETLQQPIFKRIYSEVTEGMRTMWAVERATNDEFTIRDWLKAVVVPIAAVSMLCWEAIVDWAEKTFSSEEWDRWWREFTKHAIWTSLDTTVDFLTDRAFIYAGMFGTDIGWAINTANVVWIENPQDFREAFFYTWARKFRTSNPIEKFSHIRSSWYETSALDLIRPETILAEIWLNQTSSARQTLNDINTAIYDLQKNYYETNDKWYNKMLNRMPVIKNAKQAGKDMWVLLPMLDKKVEDSWAKWFLKESTSRTELARLINNMEKNVMLENKDFKERALQNVGNVDALSDEELKTAMIKAWVYTDDLKAWDIVKKWLSKENLSWKWEATLWLEMLNDEDRDHLFEEFNNMYQTYVIDKGKADVATNAMFDKFVLAATKYGWSMSMAWYMWAYATAYKAAARSYYWLTSSEVTAWDKWDEWLAAEENIDLKNLPDSKYWNYIRYVDEIRSFEQSFIVDNWDVLSREKSIGIDLLNNYIQTDKENFWRNSYLGSIGDEKSNMSKLWNILNYNEIAKDQWLQWVILPLAYQEKKAADWYLLALQNAKTPEDVALVWEKFLGIQESLWGLSERFSDNPQTEGLIKASLASWLVSFAEEINKKSPWMLEKVIDIIGEKAINKVLNSLTDSPTVTMADAFEIATNVSAHSWSGSWWSSLSIP